jgi:hypothetical protein
MRGRVAKDGRPRSKNISERPGHILEHACHADHGPSAALMPTRPFAPRRAAPVAPPCATARGGYQRRDPVVEHALLVAQRTQVRGAQRAEEVVRVAEVGVTAGQRATAVAQAVAQADARPVGTAAQHAHVLVEAAKGLEFAGELEIGDLDAQRLPVGQLAAQPLEVLGQRLERALALETAAAGIGELLGLDPLHLHLAGGQRRWRQRGGHRKQQRGGACKGNGACHGGVLLVDRGYPHPA